MRPLLPLHHVMRTLADAKLVPAKTVAYHRMASMYDQQNKFLELRGLELRGPLRRAAALSGEGSGAT